MSKEKKYKNAVCGIITKDNRQLIGNHTTKKYVYICDENGDILEKIHTRFIKEISYD